MQSKREYAIEAILDGSLLQQADPRLLSIMHVLARAWARVVSEA